MKTMIAELRPLRTLTLVHCFGLAFAVLMASAASARAQRLPGPEYGEWLYPGGHAGHLRHEPLTHVHTDTVEDLQGA